MSEHDFNTLDGLNQYVHKVIESALRTHAETGSQARLAVVINTWDPSSKQAFKSLQPIPIIMHKSDESLSMIARRTAQHGRARAVFMTSIEDGVLRVTVEHATLGLHEWTARVTSTAISELKGPQPGRPIRMLPSSYMN